MRTTNLVTFVYSRQTLRATTKPWFCWKESEPKKRIKISQTVSIHWMNYFLDDPTQQIFRSRKTWCWVLCRRSTNTRCRYLSNSTAKQTFNCWRKVRTHHHDWRTPCSFAWVSINSLKLIEWTTLIKSTSLTSGTKSTSYSIGTSPKLLSFLTVVTTLRHNSTRWSETISRNVKRLQ